jgi:hypothetical protein
MFRSRNRWSGRRGSGQPRRLVLGHLGEVDRGATVAVNQIVNSLARLIELERRIREQEILEERVAAMEAVLLRSAR